MKSLIEDREWLVWSAGVAIVLLVVPHHFERIIPLAMSLAAIALILHAVRWVAYPGLYQSKAPEKKIEEVLLTWLALLFLPIVVLTSWVRFIPRNVFSKLYPVNRLVVRTGLGFGFRRGQAVRIDPSSAKLNYRLALGRVRKIEVVSRKDEHDRGDEMPVGTVVYSVWLNSGSEVEFEESDLDPLYEQSPTTANEYLPSTEKVQVPVWHQWVAVGALLTLVSIFIAVLRFARETAWWPEEFSVLILVLCVALFFWVLSSLGYSSKVESFRQERLNTPMMWLFGIEIVILLVMALAVVGMFFVIIGVAASTWMLLLLVTTIVGFKLSRLRGR